MCATWVQRAAQDWLVLTQLTLHVPAASVCVAHAEFLQAEPKSDQAKPSQTKESGLDSFGFSWFSFVRFGTFQWVMRDPNQKLNLGLVSSAALGSSVRGHGWNPPARLPCLSESFRQFPRVSARASKSFDLPSDSFKNLKPEALGLSKTYV